jgi:hypothetical protein
MNISDNISESLETIFRVKILELFDADPEIFLTLDPGWKKFGSGINIPDPQRCYIGTDLLFGLVEGGECCVSLLPEKLPGAQERLRMLELPPLTQII